MGEAVVNGSTIDGVVIQSLQQIRDERGSVMHMLRSDSYLFERFGEVYFSTVGHGVVKAWKRHRVMTQNFTVPVGQVKFVIFDDRENSHTRGNLLEVITGVDQYALAKIPPELWYGFKGLGPDYSLIVNCTTVPFDEKEVERVERNSPEVPYKW